MADRLYERIGAAIRTRRDELGMTQTALSVESGIGRTTVTNIELGLQSVMVHQLVAIARVLGSDPRDFIPDLDDLYEEQSGPPMVLGPSVLMADLLGRLDTPVRGRSR